MAVRERWSDAERTHRPLLMVLNVVDSNLALLDDAEYSLHARASATNSS
jgi:hypothetical protein